MQDAYQRIRLSPFMSPFSSAFRVLVMSHPGYTCWKYFIISHTFSGGTPGKILRVLSHMNIACFTAQTFYNHQRRYLDPAVISVLETKQSTLLDQCRASGVPLTIGGDGWTDSPGHSAKYGSYGIIELATTKLLTYN